jgi:hypothetical protein
MRQRGGARGRGFLPSCAPTLPRLQLLIILFHSPSWRERKRRRRERQKRACPEGGGEDV